METFFSDLKRLAYNLWWSWNKDAKRLFKAIHPALWAETKENPLSFLKKLTEAEVEGAFSRKEISDLYRSVISDFDSYIKAERTWFSEQHKNNSRLLVAYFSAEFGVNESLPIYAGGLGVLAGDHLKSASDLGIPLIGVGLLYRQGYFIQSINKNGGQEASYERHLFDDMPVTAVKDYKGEDLIINFEILDRNIFAKIWRAEVGRIPLFLLDSDIVENSPEDRQITYKLYGGGEDMRIIQEILLGIGGVMAIYAMGIAPSVWHMNEGHSVFLGLDRISRLMKEERLTYNEALEAVKTNTIFTTHTPLPAGNDAFSIFLMNKYFRPYLKKTGIMPHEFLNLGLRIMKSGSDLFSLTVFGIHISSSSNAVSRLHSHVTRKMWSDLWSGLPVGNIPIQYITNGIHASSWLAPDMERLFDRYFENDWKDKIGDHKIWERVHEIPDREFWDIHNSLKKKMIAGIENRAVIPSTLTEDALTICFARRFTTYKRANLILKNMERLRDIISNSSRPVHLIFSGKAHPADKPGQELIRKIYEVSQRPEFHGRIVFLENYDMLVARYLVSGADVWLNTPRRPLEASGTSGQKAAVNGVINFSVLDGWWCEGFSSDIGWAIGDSREYASEDEQDDAEADEIYKVLEEEIVPMYYKRDADGIPYEWIKMMKSSIAAISPVFNSHRMVKEYVESFYIPSSERRMQLSRKNYAKVKELADWKQWVRKNWEYIKIVNITKRIEEENGEKIMELIITVDLGPLSPADVTVDTCVGKFGMGKDSYCERCIPMALQGEIWEGFFTYNVKFKMGKDLKGFSFMVVPFHTNIGNKYEMGLIKSRYIQF